MRNVYVLYMSAQLPPDPILTTYQYWNWKPVDEATRRQRALDNTYMMFPTVQNNPVSFSKLFLITDAALTKAANTAYVIANLVPYLASLPPLVTSTTWLALQNFTTIETDTVNPIGAGTLTIGSGVDHDIRIASQNSRSVVLHLGDGNTSSGDVLINSGEDATGGVTILNGLGSTGTITLGVAGTTLSLGCPLTPTYPYPNISGAIGVRSTAIGYIAFVSAIGSNTFGPGTSGSGVSLRYADLTAGTWLLAGWVRFPSGSNLTNTNVNFSTQLNNIGGQIARKGNLTLGTSGTIPTNSRALTTTAVVFVSVTTRYYFNVCNATTGGITNCDMRPTRIA